MFEQLKASKVISGWELDARSRANIFALAAADEAIKDCGWQAQTEYEQARTGTSIATGLAGMSEISETAIALNSSPKGYRTINPYFIAKILPNLSSGLISIKYNLKVGLLRDCLVAVCFLLVYFFIFVVVVRVRIIVFRLHVPLEVIQFLIVIGSLRIMWLM